MPTAGGARLTCPAGRTQKGRGLDLHLSDDDRDLLREILDSAYRDLSYEIADTDNYTFRQQLKDRRERVGRILTEVGGPLEDKPL
ncbi:MAG: hypothetical protein JJLCMIEE_03589 [Acidimicrobiales bacterium]|nr:hypothetical protein [Acidimicrobiales bacterium]